MSDENTGKRVWLNWLVYAGLAVLVIWALYSSTMQELSRIPERDAAADLGQYGLVTIRFFTDPHPPSTANPVTMNFTPMNSRQRPVEVDQITYEYGLDGSEQVVGTGVAQSPSGSSGRYIAIEEFSDAGKWWISATVHKGDVQADVLFTIDLKPASEE